VQNYNGWLAGNTNNVERPEAQYYRAWATYQAGNETNALIQFTNFVAQFPTDELAPMAQWWIADHYFRQGDYLSAEKNYKSLFQTWPNSELALQAYLMAGRAAAGCLNFSGAIEYFTNLTSRLDCPPKLKTQALFAYGDALVQLGPTDTNRMANVDLARQVYSQVCLANPTNEQSLLAWGKIGDCYLQLGLQNSNFYTNALAAYLQVVTSPYAGVAARSQAQVGVGLVLEKEAQTKSGDEQAAWLKQALGNYLDVVYEINLRDGETRDLYWTKKAGLEAARLAESLQEWSQAIKLYQRLETLMPQLQGSFDKKIARAQEEFLHGGS
jgi:tetratricopeptide (TPR) repeat protein